ncbi:DNA alkylation repair protein [Compostimonas suwonensis]|nr:DNA alkylation repair protein [Compostimonas suwonensis]
MNELIDRGTVDRLRGILTEAAARVASVEPAFTEPAFATPAFAEPPFPALRQAAHGVDGLNLRARSDLVSAALEADLPDDYRAVSRLFRAALENPGFDDWMIWPVSETTTTLALASPDPRDFDDGLALLAELTPRLTAEFAIRRFLEADLERSLASVERWTSSDDEHVRRLASEGTRPFLPWARRVRSVLASPESTVPILDALYRDESEYVRRSVANHLNDLSREQPELVTAVAAGWLRHPDENTVRVVRHGLRTLVKKAHPGALALMGFEEAAISVSEPVLDTAVVTLPGELGFAFEVTNEGETATRLGIDYVVYYVKSNGSHSEKVFKLTTALIEPGATLRVAKRHAFRPMTTRVHYAGEHALELQINGRRYAKTGFDVVL